MLSQDGANRRTEHGSELIATSLLFVHLKATMCHSFYILHLMCVLLLEG